MKKLLLSIVALLSLLKINAQNCNGFIKTYDTLVVVNTYSLNGSSDLMSLVCGNGNIQRGYLTRMTSTGNILWIKKIPSSNGISLVQKHDGNFLYYGCDTTNDGIHNASIKKFDSNGTVVGNYSLPQNFHCYDFDLDGNSNYIVIGRAYSTLVIGTNTLTPSFSPATGSGPAVEEDVLLKYDVNFNNVIAKFLFNWNATSFIGGYVQYPYIMADKTTNDFYYINSASNTGIAVTADFGNSISVTGTNGYYLAKFNSFGICQWVQNETNIVPPVHRNWKIHSNNIYITSININPLSTNLNIHATSSGSLVATKINNNPLNYVNGTNYLSDPNFIYSSYSQSSSSNVFFIDKYDYNFNLIARKYFGNNGSSSAINNVSQIGNEIYFGTGPYTNDFYAPAFIHEQIPTGTKCFYGRLNSDLDIIKGDFLGNDLNLLCGQSHTLSLTTNNPSPFNQNITGITYSYTPAQGLAFNGSLVVASPSVSMQYVGTIINGTCSVKDTVNINVDAISNFSYTANNMVVNFSKLSANCTSFIWDFGNGNTSTINPNPVVTYASAGTYGVCLQCNGASNCAQCININVPANGTGAIGISELTKNECFKLFPNPTNGKINLELLSDHFQNANLVITDVLGNNVLSEKLSDTLTHEIDLTNYAKGIYFISVSNSSEKPVVSKIVIN